jgi:DNA-binding MarR family transcriptional regulator
MSASLTDFRDELQESLLTLLWQQWCICGVQGHAKEPPNWCIDPEVLLLLTCSLGRREPRMFDEMLDLLKALNPLINLQRLKSLAKSNNFTGAKVLGAVAGYLDYDILKKEKWTSAITKPKPVGDQTPLYFFKDGRPMESFGLHDSTFYQFGFVRAPVNRRGLIGPFDIRHPACLLLRLRSFLGTTSRSGICLYLCTHPEAPGENPSQIARETGHNQKAIQDALVRMSLSAYIERQENKREILYTMTPEMKKALCQDLKAEPLWCNWIAVGAFLEKIWVTFDDNKFIDADPMVQSIKLREIIEKFKGPISRSGIPVMLETRGHLEGEEYVDWVMGKTKEIVTMLVDGERAGK